MLKRWRFVTGSMLMATVLMLGCPTADPADNENADGSANVNAVANDNATANVNATPNDNANPDENVNSIVNGNENENGGSSIALLPDWELPDLNPNSPRAGQVISVRDYRGEVSAWYFGHST